jgi:outer membrane protein assembly factor BamD|tara:strand:- start:1603 stop:2436 length:834 start_codon:yes stop_codon:yes gene_type:complete
MLKSLIVFLISALLILSCSKKDKIEATLEEGTIEEQMILAYKEGLEFLEKGDALYASKKFNEAEILFPQSIWAPKSSVMSAYSLYYYNYYGDAIFQLERHLKNYPNDKNLAYVHYLIAICYFEKLSDEKKDLEPLIQTQKKFEYIINNYPNTDFAIDSKYKLDLILDMLAAKEMYIGRHYMETEKWIGAINRFKNVINNYDDTVYVEEALHRLVEIYYKIGLIDEAKKVAYVLGYNYESGKWYENSYRVFNKSYKKVEIDNKKKDFLLIKKFKSLFE